MMITFTTTSFDFSQSVNRFYVTWAVIFFLAYPIYSWFTIIWRLGIDISTLIKTYPDGFLKITRETSNRSSVTHGRFDKRYHQFPTKFKAFYTCISCIHCIYCLISMTLLLSRTYVNVTSVHLLTSKGTYALIGYVGTTFSKIVYFICVCFLLFVISHIMSCFGCM